MFENLTRAEKALFAVIGTLFGAGVTAAVTYKVGVSRGEGMPSTRTHDDFLEGKTEGLLAATKRQESAPYIETMVRLDNLENRVSRAERSYLNNASNW